MSLENLFNGNNLELSQYKRPLVIYHGNCADGFSAAWCFHHSENRTEIAYDYHPGVYGEDILNGSVDIDDRIIYLVDFSYKREIVEQMLERSRGIYLIDHHKTAIEDLGPLKEHKKFIAYTDLERSGAMLAWDFLFNTRWEYPEDNKICLILDIKPTDFDYFSPPTLLGHIQDRDLWKFKLALTREIQANVFSYEYTFENWDKLMLETSTLQLAEGGMAIERKHFKDIRELIKVAKRQIIIEHPQDSAVFWIMPCLNCPYMWTSDAGHIMATEVAGMAAVTYYDTAEKRIFSLRSIEGGPDVSEIAKLFGGGGHKHAAGFSVPRDHELARF